MLQDANVKVSRPRVACLMRKNGIQAKTRRKFKVTTNSDHNYPISPNLLEQDFTASEPGKVWTSGITYIPTLEGWLYLAVVLELFNRQIVGWAMSDSLKPIDTSIPVLVQAYQRFHPNPNLIFHYDGGIQYACHEFREKINHLQICQSMSGKGNCYDNAVTESFFSTLKKELVHHCQFLTRSQARQFIFSYIEIFYNRQRKHSSLNYMTPEQFMKAKKVA